MSETSNRLVHKTGRIVELFSRGLSNSEIANEIGCNEESLRLHIRKIGLTRSDEEKRELRRRSARKAAAVRAGIAVSQDLNYCESDVFAQLEAIQNARQGSAMLLSAQQSAGIVWQPRS